MSKFTISLAAAAALFISACGNTKQPTVSDLTGEWNIIAVNGATIATPDGQEQPYIGFDTANGRVFGNASCNSIMGSFNTASPAGVIDLSNMASTRMMCPDMDLEQSILTALGHVTTYKFSGVGDIELCDASGSPMLTLKKRDNYITPKSLTGEWKINEVEGTDLSADSIGTYTMTFTPADSTFEATTGCNNISGIYTGEYVDIEFSNMRSTRMACPDMSVEETMNRVLPTIKSFGELQHGAVGFYNTDNDLVLVLSKQN